MARIIGAYLYYLEPRHIEQLEAAAAEAGFEIRYVNDLEKEGSMLNDAEILFTYTPEPMRYCGSGLKWVCTSWAGINAYTGAENDGLFEGRDCILTNSTGVYGETISEHIIMTVLMLCRNMPRYILDQQAHRWGKAIEMKSIRGSRITMLGAGNIAITTAKKMRALGAASIKAVSRSGIAREEGVFDEIYSIDHLDEILPETEMLIMTMPGTPETSGMIDSERLALLPSDAIVVNIGRGSAIILDDIVSALNNGEIAGAALDVFPEEPLPEDSPAWTARNMIITPHAAGNMTLAYSRDRTVDQFCEDLALYAAGKTPLRIVDRSRGY